MDLTETSRRDQHFMIVFLRESFHNDILTNAVVYNKHF